MHEGAFHTDAAAVSPGHWTASARLQATFSHYRLRHVYAALDTVNHENLLRVYTHQSRCDRNAADVAVWIVDRMAMNYPAGLLQQQHRHVTTYS